MDGSVISDQEKEIRDQAIKGRGSGIKDQESPRITGIFCYPSMMDELWMGQ